MKKQKKGSSKLDLFGAPPVCERSVDIFCRLRFSCIFFFLFLSFRAFSRSWRLIGAARGRVSNITDMPHLLQINVPLGLRKTTIWKNTSNS